MPEYLAVGEQAARAGGKILLDMQERITPREKNPRDLVTEADVASQEAIRRILLGAFPEHDFVGEEEDATANLANQSSSFRWIVDPLDGTTNYVHKLQTFAVSIGLEHDGELIAGVVFDPVLDDCYTAARGAGAHVNGNKLCVSDCTDLDRALLAASFSANVPRGSLEVTRFVEVLHRCRALRRMGSAALNLCYVAAGSLDGYWASSVKCWDVAAGVLIVREAGGVVTDIGGGDFDLNRPVFAASATRPLHQQLLAALADAKYL